MKKIIILILLSSVLLATPPLLMAEDVGWIRSVPQAMPETQIYRINVQRVNGHMPMISHRYRVPAGKATIRVSLILESQWAPKLKRIQDRIFSQVFTMNIDAGTTYIIGGKVNKDATRKEQDSGTFWHPTIYQQSTGE